MLDKLLKITGTLALYGCASMFLATLLLGAYLTYTWNIDKTRRIRLLALAQGHDITDIQKAVEDRIAEMSYDQVLELRAKRLREEETKEMSSEKEVTTLLLADEKKINAELKKIRSERAAYEKYVKDQMDKARSAGIAEETRILEEAEAEWASAAILRLLRERGATQRVLTMLMAMEEKNRSEILYAMTGEDEQKELIDLLQRIGDGEPMAKVLEDAEERSKEVKE